jgi:hypothetical protein
MTHVQMRSAPDVVPAARPATSRRNMTLAVAGAYVLAVAFRLVLSANRIGPLVVGDEIGYLAHARVLAGEPDLAMQGTYYYSGSSLLMVPAFWFTDNALTAYQGVLVTQALISAAVLPLLYLLCRELDVSQARSLAAAVVASSLVDAVVWSSYALAESLLAALTVAWVWLTVRVVRHGRSRSGLVSAGALGLVFGLLAAAHSRGLVLVAIGAIAGVACIRWAGWRNVLVCAGVGAVAVASGLWLNVSTMHANYAGRTAASLIPGGTGGGEVALTDQLTSTLGQVWYAAVATGLLGLYGILHAWYVGLTAPATQKPAWITAATLLTVGGGAIAFGAAVVLRAAVETPTPDYLVYGRYVTSVLPLATAFGVLGLLAAAGRVAWILRAATVAAAAGLCLLVHETLNDLDPALLARPFPIPGVHAVAQVVAADDGRVHELRVTAAAIAFFAVLCALSAVRHVAARVALTVIPTVTFAALSPLSLSSSVLALDHLAYPDGGDAVDALDDARTIAWDEAIGGDPTSQVVTRMRLAYFADEAELVPFDSRTGRPPSGVDLVAGSTLWDASRDGLVEVTRVPPFDVILWKPAS